MHYKIFLFVFFQFFLLYGQDEYQFLGVLKLQDDTFISYKISFEEENGILKGYSLTDLGGAHETKSYLSGFFDEKNNSLEFYESGIIYTKSFVSKNDFCNVHFKGALIKLNQNQQIEGQFKGLYSDGKECIDGELKLSNLGKILKQAQKIDKKVAKSILISKEKKEKVNLVKDLDSLNTNRLNKNDNLSLFTNANKITLNVYDAGQIDGDKISIQVNGIFLYKEMEATARKKEIQISLTKPKTEVKITALNNGKIGGNTVMLEITDQKNKVETVTNLKQGESASFVFIKK